MLRILKFIIRLTGLSFFILSGVLFSCRKEKIPVLTTSPVTNITGNSATSGGMITIEGSAAITEQGVCWSTSTRPSVLDYKISAGAGSDTFTCDLSNLMPSLTYYVRAYATNKAGTGYGEVMTFTTKLADIDGNIYTAVTIGTQIWTGENLKTTRFNDGNPIPLVISNPSWSTLTTPGYSWYDNDASTYKASNGALYNWYAVNTGKLCPAGWHVPSEMDWETLTIYLTLTGFGFGGSGTDIAKSIASKTGWSSSTVAGTVGNNQSGNNASGFTAFPAGIFVAGKYYILGETGVWWTTKNFNTSSSWSRQLNYSSSDFEDKVVYSNYCGLSVRCLKD